jgi:hypothetical protein
MLNPERQGQTSYKIWPEGDSFKVLTPEVQNQPEELLITNLNLKGGYKYIAEITAINKASLGNKQESRGVTVDSTPPLMSKVILLIKIFLSCQ